MSICEKMLFLKPENREAEGGACGTASSTLDFAGDSVGKGSACDGERKDPVRPLGREDPGREEMATHSCPCPAGCNPWGRKSRTTTGAEPPTPPRFTPSAGVLTEGRLPSTDTWALTAGGQCHLGSGYRGSGPGKPCQLCFCVTTAKSRASLSLSFLRKEWREWVWP